MTSRWWPALCLMAIGTWVGVTLAGAYVWPGGEVGGRYAFVAFGAVFFAALFGYAAWFTRRTQRSAQHDLYERLALEPVSARVLRESTSQMYGIGYVYFAAGALVSALGLGAVAAYGTPWESHLLRIAIGLVVLWSIYMLYARRLIANASTDLFAPLGLQLVSMPSLIVNPFRDSESMPDAVSYAGRRRGRDVAIVMGSGVAGVIVSGPPETSRVPKTPKQMADLTGLPVSCWRDVTVSIVDDDVVVRRTGRDCGRWFLHDLLLAESVGGRVGSRDSKGQP